MKILGGYAWLLESDHLKETFIVKTLGLIMKIID